MGSEIFYSFIVLIVQGVVLIRSRSVGLVAILFALLGSFFLVLFPSLSALIVLCYILAGAGLLYEIFFKGRGD